MTTPAKKLLANLEKEDAARTARRAEELRVAEIEAEHRRRRGEPEPKHYTSAATITRPPQ